jgi:hypothetical protein
MKKATHVLGNCIGAGGTRGCPQPTAAALPFTSHDGVHTLSVTHTTAASAAQTKRKPAVAVGDGRGWWCGSGRGIRFGCAECRPAPVDWAPGCDRQVKTATKTSDAVTLMSPDQRKKIQNKNLFRSFEQRANPPAAVRCLLLLPAAPVPHSPSLRQPQRISPSLQQLQCTITSFNFCHLRGGFAFVFACRYS